MSGDDIDSDSDSVEVVSKKNNNKKNNKKDNSDNDSDSSKKDKGNNNRNNSKKGKDNNNKKGKDSKKQKKTDTTDWKNNPQDVTKLLDIYNKYCDEFAKMDKKGWQKTTKEFQKQTKKNYSKQTLQSKMTDLKGLYSKFQKLKQESGMGWNENEKRVLTSDNRWAQLLEADPTLAPFKSSGLPNYDLLNDIFMSKTATGKYAQGGDGKDDEVHDDDEDDDNDNDDEDQDKVTAGTKRKRGTSELTTTTKRPHSTTPSIAAKKEQTSALIELSEAIKNDPTEHKKEKAKELLNAYLQSFRTPLSSRLSLKLKKNQIKDYEIVENLSESELDEWALDVCDSNQELKDAIEKKNIEVEALKISRNFFSSCKFKVKNNDMKVIEDTVLENASTICNFDRDEFESWAIDETTAADAILAERAKEFPNE